MFYHLSMFSFCISCYYGPKSSFKLFISREFVLIWCESAVKHKVARKYCFCFDCSQLIFTSWLVQHNYYHFGSVLPEDQYCFCLLNHVTNLRQLIPFCQQLESFLLQCLFHLSLPEQLFDFFNQVMRTSFTTKFGVSGLASLFFLSIKAFKNTGGLN